MARYRAEISKGESLRYLSHLDYAELFVRAIRRAKLPAAYSEGFNPHLKLAFASALAVGVTSDAEYMDFELAEPLMPDEVAAKLQANLPPGAEIHEVRLIVGKQPSLMAAADLAGYDVRLPHLGEPMAAEKCVAAFNAAPKAIWHRVTPKKTRDIDVKEYLAAPLRLKTSPGELRLNMRIHIKPTGSIKPSEILSLLREGFGLAINEHQAIINRTLLFGKGRPLIELGTIPNVTYTRNQ